MQLPSDSNYTGRNFGQAELDILKRVIESGTLNCTKGTVIKEFEKRFSDKYGDLQGTGLGIGGCWSDPPEDHTGGYLMGIPEIPGEISFTFMATDIVGDTAEREYTFYIASGDLI